MSVELQEANVFLDTSPFQRREVEQPSYLATLIQKISSFFFSSDNSKLAHHTAPPLNMIHPGTSWGKSLWKLGAYETAELSPNEVERPPLPGISHRVRKNGELDSPLRIGGINGIWNSAAVATQNWLSLIEKAGGYTVDWVYNHSTGYISDALEVIGLNLFGYSPYTSALLRQNWLEFHEENALNPDVKYLQICHSQGAVHVRNALENVSDEIRKRVVVVALAPAAIVPSNLCFRSYNYASKNDIVYLVEKVYDMTVGRFKANQEDKFRELVLLDPHPKAPLFDHEFLSPTLMSMTEEHVKRYIALEGRYPG